MRISFVVAAADNGVIGKKGGGLPWRQKSDMERFRMLTLNHPVIMGRKTQQEISFPLPDRINIVITSQPNYAAPGWTVVRSVEDALKLARTTGTDEAMVIGGGEIFEAAMPLADKIYLTEVHANLPGGAHFFYDKTAWQEIKRQDYPADADNQYPYSFIELERV